MLKKKQRHPIRYAVEPRVLANPGVHWVTLHLENIGEHALTGLSVNLSSLDGYALDVHGTGTYIDKLHGGDERALPFQLTARRSGLVYAVVAGQQGDRPFAWESPGMRLQVGTEAARLARFFALTEPYPRVGHSITCEAVIRARAAAHNLMLEFWMETPRDTDESLAKLGTETLAPGEETRYSVQFTPEDAGNYVLHAYLFDGTHRIGHWIDYVNATP